MINQVEMEKQQFNFAFRRHFRDTSWDLHFILDDKFPEFSFAKVRFLIGLYLLTQWHLQYHFRMAEALDLT